MSYEKKYPNLYQFFGYFHQDWMEAFRWEGKKPSYQPVIRKYKTETEKTNLTIIELKGLLKTGEVFDDEKWSEILTWSGLGLCYYPPGDNLTYKEWLKDVLKILEEPMEETLKHWIPKRINE